jgi:hypothetical protein
MKRVATRANGRRARALARRTLADRADASAATLARATRSHDPTAIPLPLLLVSIVGACLLAFDAVSRIRRRRDVRQLLKKGRRSG